MFSNCKRDIHKVCVLRLSGLAVYFKILTAFLYYRASFHPQCQPCRNEHCVTPYQARNQPGTPGGAKSFLRGAQILWTISNSFKLCPIHFSRGSKKCFRDLRPPCAPFVTGLLHDIALCSLLGWLDRALLNLFLLVWFPTPMPHAHTNTPPKMLKLLCERAGLLRFILVVSEGSVVHKIRQLCK